MTEKFSKSTQRWKLNLHQISLKFSQSFLKIWKSWELILKKVCWECLSRLRVKKRTYQYHLVLYLKVSCLWLKKKVFPRSSHLSTRTTRSRFFRNSVECGNCTLVDVVKHSGGGATDKLGENWVAKLDANCGLWSGSVPR